MSESIPRQYTIADKHVFEVFKRYAKIQENFENLQHKPQSHNLQTSFKLAPVDFRILGLFYLPQTKLLES